MPQRHCSPAALRPFPARLVLLAVFLFCFVVACASRHFNEAEPQLVGGAEVKINAYPGVLNILTSPSCTGAKIASRAILTARHCVLGYAAGTKLDLQIGSDRSAEKVLSTEITKVSTYPESAAGRVDVAVIEVKGGLDRVATAALAESSPGDGAVVDLVGYGCTARLDSGLGGGGLAAGPSTGVLRALRGPLAAVEPTQFVFLGTFSGLAGTSGLCPGDSGGPLYWNISRTNVPSYRVAGVNASYHPEGKSRFARVDAGAKAINAWVKSLSK